jgi:hypothetical protein
MAKFIIEDLTVHAQCATDQEAQNLVDEVQSVSGSNLERDGSMVYAIVTDPDEAEKELEGDGHSVEVR